MKKIYMTLVAVMFAVCASAQVYVGGNVGIASYEVNDHDETVYSLLPEVGYKFNDDWAAGVMFGWSTATVSRWSVWQKHSKSTPMHVTRSCTQNSSMYFATEDLATGIITVQTMNCQ